MHTPIDQNTNERIHHFLASKTSSKSISRMIADWLVPTDRTNVGIRKGISYERLDWSQK